MKKGPTKIRLKDLLVESYGVEKTKVEGLILSGEVFINDSRITKVNELVDPAVALEIRSKKKPFVSRGGEKLAHALGAFNVDLVGKCCMDVGVSTGGFTDCMLKSGAKLVYAIDVGYGDLAMNLRNSDAVILFERTNIRHFSAQHLNHQIEFVAADVSFISLTTVIEAVSNLISQPFTLVGLIKPQFELPKEDIPDGGIVKSSTLHDKAIGKVRDFALTLGLEVKGLVASPILGAKGNKEFLIYLKKN